VKDAGQLTLSICASGNVGAAGFEGVAAAGGTTDAGLAPRGCPDPGNSVFTGIEEGPAIAPALGSSSG
jgi:hypothetical protein